jgi:hypothetical protein
VVPTPPVSAGHCRPTAPVPPWRRQRVLRRPVVTLCGVDTLVLIWRGHLSTAPPAAWQAIADLCQGSVPAPPTGRRPTVSLLATCNLGTISAIPVLRRPTTALWSWLVRGWRTRVAQTLALCMCTKRYVPAGVRPRSPVPRHRRLAPPRACLRVPRSHPVITAIIPTEGVRYL